MKPKLTDDQVINKMSMVDLYRHYFPEATENEADFVIWNETCFPMSFDTAHDQIYKKYQDTFNSPLDV